MAALLTPVYVRSMQAVTPAGTGVSALWQKAVAKESCIQESDATDDSGKSVFSALFSAAQLAAIDAQTAHLPHMPALERIAYCAAHEALQSAGLPASETVLFFSTTKGNIDLLGVLPHAYVRLYNSALRVAAALGITAKPVVVSQACVSGLVALTQAARMLQRGATQHALVVGVDLVSPFVLAGFGAFRALAPAPCRPFDAGRQGINLGEGAGAILLTRDAAGAVATFAGGAASNDANHISGPSRTGQELAMAIRSALLQAMLHAEDMDAISAHGTATVYNDEMESQAFGLAGVLHAPVHSLKGITGHTLGAAGILESIIAVECIRQQIALPSAGFEVPGVSQPVLILPEARPARLRHVLKTASGFGGVNAAGIFSRLGTA